MKEISDSEFDRIFQKRVEEYDFQFEESAWNKMEQKLRRRDRFVFIGNLSAAAFVLLMCAFALYFLMPQKASQNIVKKESRHGSNSTNVAEKTIPSESAPIALAQKKSTDTAPLTTGITLNDINPVITAFSLKTEHPSQYEIPKALMTERLADDSLVATAIEYTHTIDNDLFSNLNKTTKSEERKNKTFKLPLSLAFSTGPDFSSVNSLIGNKATWSFGIMLNAAISNKFSLSTGVKYGGKDYNASGFNYNLSPSLKSQITEIEGSCNVLEIPLRASYTVFSKKPNSITLNSGLSSYLMLKERYVFKYTPQSKINDYVLQEHNANQHYLSILDISASFKTKLKGQKAALGIEPYIKVPLQGIGEGKVNLKSSGISLNLYYDLSKK
ncbi:hypothetical protein [Rubrolithibacter danxiaensis]|uniref:hypothetical protein n=1 Tax=Rubrolithibacter danxiaensis TaxID=3390805 RepID=UPI003BF77875